MDMSNASNTNHDPQVGRDHFAHWGKRQAHQLQRHLLAFQSLNKLFQEIFRKSSFSYFG